MSAKEIRLYKYEATACGPHGSDNMMISVRARHLGEARKAAERYIVEFCDQPERWKVVSVVRK